jgi:hypothetical protein
MIRFLLTSEGQAADLRFVRAPMANGQMRLTARFRRGWR